MRAFRRLFEWSHRPTEAERKYHHAMQKSEELLEKIRGDESSNLARAVVQDILTNRRNGPYMTTVYEAVEEVNSPLKQVSQRS